MYISKYIYLLHVNNFVLFHIIHITYIFMYVSLPRTCDAYSLDYHRDGALCAQIWTYIFTYKRKHSFAK